MQKTKTVHALAKLALVVATVIWGSSFFIMKDTLDAIEPFYLLAVRFTLASVILSLIFVRDFRWMSWDYVRRGALMGVFLLAAYAFQTYGLQFTTPGKNAFLTAVYCLLVPFFCWGITRVRPDRYTMVAAVICLVGIGFVSFSSPGEGTGFVNIGDMLTLLGGVMYAVHIIYVNRASEGRNIVLLTMLQFLSAAVIAWVLGLCFNEPPKAIPSEARLSLLYLGAMPTAAALLLQNVGQKYTKPATAALLLSLEAVFGVLFSVWFADEQLTPPLVFGFSLIFFALVMSETKFSFLKKS